jgi:hypothetical protein
MFGFQQFICNYFFVVLKTMDSEKAAMVETNSEDDVEEVEEEEDGTEMNQEKLSAAMLRNPQVMAALQARLDSMVGDPSGYIKVHEHENFLSCFFSLTILTGM